ncbi:MAG: hypothetical protein LUF01_11240 [Bacteroides sp.]|nr:hypothetical protein [Bacteroides sp.]
MNKLLLTALLAVCPYIATAQISQKRPEQRPLIGISCSHPGYNSSTRMTYTESVIRAGGHSDAHPHYHRQPGAGGRYQAPRRHCPDRRR